MDEIYLVKSKREFSKLPDGIVKIALDKCNSDVKKARSFLRKYFGVFLTNKVLRFARSQVTGHGLQEVLGSHISSKKRNYREFYERIFEKVKGRNILDLGCGVNGFSYEFLQEVVGDVRYVGIEAAGQLVDFMNSYFKENGFDGKAIRGDLLDLVFTEKVLKSGKFNVVFLFQVSCS